MTCRPFDFGSCGAAFLFFSRRLRCVRSIISQTVAAQQSAEFSREMGITVTCRACFLSSQRVRHPGSRGLKIQGFFWSRREPWEALETPGRQAREGEGWKPEVEAALSAD